MPSRFVQVGQGVMTSLLLTSALAGVQGACSSDGGVDFSDVPPGRGILTATGGTSGSPATAGGTSGDAGTTAAGGKQAGSSSGGVASAGTANEAGATGEAGAAAAAGSDAGGGGSDGGGTNGGGNGGNSAGNGGTGGAVSCHDVPELCDGLDNDCDGQADPPGTCPNECVGATHGGHVYYFCGAVVSGQAASNRCAAYGMTLVALDSAEENAFVQENSLTGTWIGATDAAEEGTWRWPDGTAFWEGDEQGHVVQERYSAWLEGQPNNTSSGPGEDCVVLLKASGLWNDFSCSSVSYRVTCEASSPPRPTLGGR